ncbi:MAG: hypothetical protein KAJ14_13725 [Candidatus Omnitrophica bacterium]|nr:hypothetical protein [Candidatus Omnitrophota bacterium]
MKKNHKLLISIAIVALILPSILQLLVCLFSGGCGSFGLRPTAHLCVGVEIDSEKAIRRLPNADIDFHILFFHFGYRVDKKDLSWPRGFCLGQDIWYGE